MGCLTFDPASHTYRVDGREVLGVTRALELAGLAGSAWYTEEARDRGTDAHLVCELYDRGCLDVSTVPEGLMGYLVAWELFLKESGLAVVGIEERRVNEALGYAGAVDRVLKARTAAELVVDIKSGARAAWMRLQLAAYRGLYPPERSARMGRMGVHLRADGTYRVEEYRDHAADWRVWCSALTVAQWRVAHGDEGRR